MKVRCVKFSPLEGIGAKYLTEGKVYEAHDVIGDGQQVYGCCIWDDEKDEVYLHLPNSSHGTFEIIPD